MGNAYSGPKRRVPHAPTAIGGIADGVRRSTADTRWNVAVKVLKLVNLWSKQLTVRDGPSAPLAMWWPTVAVLYRYNRTQ